MRNRGREKLNGMLKSMQELYGNAKNWTQASLSQSQCPNHKLPFPRRGYEVEKITIREMSIISSTKPYATVQN